MWLKLPLATRYSLLAERAILSLRIIDPACGSGHFLLAAARRLGKELARVRTGEDEPAPEAVREAVRDVISHCIYGVDKNPLAVELCRVALWLEAHVPGKPLTFLDHRIKCGDSLVGVFDLEVLKKGIPDEAFKPVEGDDRKLARELAKLNKAARKSLFAERANSLFKEVIEKPLKELAEKFRTLEELPDDSPENINKKKELYESIRHSPLATRLLTAANLWTAAFFLPKTEETRAFVPTSEKLYSFFEKSSKIDARILAHAEALAEKLSFFHWPLEFSEVFCRRMANSEQRMDHSPNNSPFAIRHSPFAGFDVVLGNPPWEQLQLEEVEFFATCAPEIARTRNSSERKKLIKQLKTNNPALYVEYLKAKYDQAATNRFIRGSGRFPLTSYGKLNTYSVFAEMALRLTGPEGRAGIIVPTGIATDDTNKHFFSHLMENGFLASLYDFKNHAGLFPAVAPDTKFSLLTLHHSPALPYPSGRGAGGEGLKSHSPLATRHSPLATRHSPLATHHSPLATRHSPKFVFFATRAEHLRDPQRRFTLTAEDIARINPNTRTTPIFRTRYDAELTKKIYRRAPVLVNEKTGENPWGISFKQGLFNMSSDSHLFRTRRELEAEGYELKGNIFVKANGERRTANRPLATRYSPLAIRHSPLADIWLPLYEAKMMWLFDHRFGTYEGLDRRKKLLPTPTEEQYSDPDFIVIPWYWVPAKEVYKKAGNNLKLISFRRVTDSMNERTGIFSLLPLSGAGDSIFFMLLTKNNTIQLCSLLGNLNSIIFDYILRQKLSGLNMNFFYVKQLPVLSPETYTTCHSLFAIPRILELTYTAWDLKPFADDLWAEADDPLRQAILKQWQENQRIANGEQGMENSLNNSPLPIRHSPNNSPLATRHYPFATRHSPPDWLEILYSLNPENPNQGACPLPPFRWDEERRARLRAELDAFFAKLYGLTEEELRYILDPQDVFGPNFPGETFRVLKEKEIRQFGEYRTKRLVLEAWEKLPSF